MMHFEMNAMFFVTSLKHPTGALNILGIGQKMTILGTPAEITGHNDAQVSMMTLLENWFPVDEVIMIDWSTRFRRKFHHNTFLFIEIQSQLLAPQQKPMNILLQRIRVQ